jgi:hypothetical protein
VDVLFQETFADKGKEHLSFLSRKYVIKTTQITSVIRIMMMATLY